MARIGFWNDDEMQARTVAIFCIMASVGRRPTHHVEYLKLVSAPMAWTPKALLGF